MSLAEEDGMTLGFSHLSCSALSRIVCFVLSLSS